MFDILVSPAFAATSAAVILCSFWRIRNVSAGPTTLVAQNTQVYTNCQKSELFVLTVKIYLHALRNTHIQIVTPYIDEAATCQVYFLSQKLQKLHSIIPT